MAVAGRVAIVPRGDFVLGNTFKRLDAVRYEGSLYIAKKDNSGILPTDKEFWMLAIEAVFGDADGITYDNAESGLDAENVQAAIDELAGEKLTIDSELSQTSENPVQNKAVAEKFAEVEESVKGANDSLENILDGTTPVGDAAKLDGLTKDSFLGNTNFNYVNKGDIDPDTIKTEFHGVINVSIAGEKKQWVILDVSNASNEITKQTAFLWELNKMLYRSWNSTLNKWYPWAPLLTPDMVSNPNLLDNWYFLNPVNQKGQTEYNFKDIQFAYSINRWYLKDGVILKVNDGYLTLSCANQAWWHYFGQKICGIKKAITATFSLLYRNTEGTFLFYGNTIPSASSEWILYSKTLSLAPNSDGIIDISLMFGMNQVATIDIQAIKLEPGDHQTLAHKEGDKWVLNEIPKYGEQLLECQRYFLRIEGTITNCGVGVCVTDTIVDICIPLPTSLRIKTPTVNFKNLGLLGDNASSISLSHDVTSLINKEVRDNCFIAQAVSTNLVKGNCYTLAIKNGGYIEIDAEIY